VAADAPFFIVGNDRSGTTMLRLILDRGPDVAIPPESMFLTDLADEREPGPGSDAEAAALVERVWRHPKVRLWRLAGGPPAVPAGLRGPHAYRFAVEAPFRAYARKEGKPRWADKTPHYVHHVDELLAVWPDARFVVLVRDGRDVALSLKRMPFGPNNAWAAAQWWARGIRAGRRAYEAHPDRVLVVRYEDVVARPSEELARVCAFLGLRFEEDMLAIERADRAKVVPDQASWFPTLFDGLSTTSAGRWEREMRPKDRRIFAALAGDELRELGYPVPDDGPADLSPARVRWYHRQNELMRNVNFVRLRVFQERGRELRFAAARRLRQRAAR
jgi:hypothetical protein